MPIMLVTVRRPGQSTQAPIRIVKTSKTVATDAQHAAFACRWPRRPSWAPDSA